MRYLALVAALVLGLGTALTAQAQTAAPPKIDPANTLILELKGGKVTIALRPDLAPKHVERVKILAKEGFYNGLKFHRVIAGFMAQSGDPTGTIAGPMEFRDIYEVSKASRPWFVVDPPDGKIPFFPWAREQRDENVAHYLDPYTICQPAGVPRQLVLFRSHQITQFPGYGSEDPRASRVFRLTQYHYSIIIKADIRTIFTTQFVCCPYDHRLCNCTFLDTTLGQCIFNSNYDLITYSSITLTAVAENTDTKHLFGAAVVSYI